MNQFQITEQEPEIIGTVNNGRVDTPTLPEPEITPEIIIEQTQQKIAEIEANFNEQLSKKDEEIALLTENLTKEKETGKTAQDLNIKGQVESKQKIKEIETTHKTELKNKDKEIVGLQKIAKQKDKELSKLFAQVKEALLND